jgi:hypothetical protein
MIPSPNQITGPDHGGIGSMIKYTVYRVEDDQTRTEISSHDSLLDGTIAAATIVEGVDFDYAYEVRTANGVAASFATGRLGYRKWATSTGRISPSLEDKYDRDEDMLLA